MQDAETAEARPSARADLVSSSVWVIIGAAIAVGSWRMDRLDSVGVQPFAAPGLVPGILGLLILAAGLLIAVRAFGRMRDEPGALSGTSSGAAMGVRRAGLTLALCLAFAAGLVGHGLPFWAAAGLYLYTHIFLLQWPERRAAGTLLRGAAVAAAVAVGVSAFVTLVFQHVFLVRLP